MCGIAGILSFREPVQFESLKKMTDVIAHRGPDGEGHWINSAQNVGLGHRRLSIIDLTAEGRQPMHFGDKRYTITYNGEIYNYIEIKEELKTKGYRFISNSDTEVLLALYDLKKERCLDELDGMFAFAIWDEKERKLFCARDRFGEKPFHYYCDSNQFLFGSEIKQFWAAGISKKIIDHRFSNFIKKGQIDNPKNVTETFYQNIELLDAAHYLTIDSNGKLSIKKYWEININGEEFKGTVESAIEQFTHLFERSIVRRLRSDVPLGTSLSGGLDSSSIVMIIDQLKKKDQKQITFSARFKNFDKDEGKYIEAVTRACKNIEANYAWPDEQYFFENFHRINYHQDEPYGATNIAAQFAVMELAKQKDVTVLIDGQGADEYLGGYLPFYKLYLDMLFYNNRKKFKEEFTAYNALHGSLRPYIAPKDGESARMKIGRWKRKILHQSMPYQKDALKRELLVHTNSTGLKLLLRYADRNSMAHSREVRLPFLSYELVEFVFSLPDNFKLNSGWTKFILRKSMDSILPGSICWRVDKIGYASPQNEWINSPFMKSETDKALRDLDIKLKENEDERVVNDMKWRALIGNAYVNKTKIHK